MDKLEVSRMRSAVRTVTAVALTALLHACTVTYGVKPQTDRLSQLLPKQSKAADVLLTLGEPRGKGVAHLSTELPSRDIWFYEFVQSNGSGMELKMLLVFFLGDTYDGHLWFSSVDAIRQK